MKKNIAGLILIILLILAGTVSAAEEITEKEQLNRSGMTVGISQGSVVEDVIRKEIPKASIAYFSDIFMGYEAAAAGKIDAFIYDLRQMEMSIQNGQKGVRLLDETLDGKLQIAVGISSVSKIPDLENKINTFITEIRADGTLDDMFQRWVIDENDQMPEIEPASDPEYRLVVGTAGTVPPYSYYKGAELNGYDIELAYRFAAWLGADTEFKVIDFGGLIPAAASGKIDCIMSNLEVEDERRENFTFSVPLFEQPAGIMVRSEDMTVSEGYDFSDVPVGVYKSLDEFSGKRIGIQTGSNFDKIVMDAIPDAEIVWMNTKADLINALQALKIDGFAADEPVAQTVMRSNEKLTYVPEYMDPFEFGYVFPKDDDGRELCSRFNEFLQKIKADGTLEEIEACWFGEDESQKTIPDHKTLPAPNGTLRMATEALYEPFIYIADNKIVGYDIDIAVRFCEAYGYGLEIIDMSFDAVLPAVQTGKCDFGGAGITITAEREESVLFSEPNFTGGTVMVVLRDEENGPAEFTSFSELNGKTVSMLTGAPFEELVRSKIPNVGQLTYFNNMPDIILTLKSGKTDAVLSNNAVAQLSISRNPELTLFPKSLRDGVFGFAFAKNSSDREAWQAACDTISEETKQALWEKWTSADESLKVLPEQDWPGLNGTVTAAVCDSLEPMSYKGKNGDLLGFDVEMILLMAKELDVHVNFIGMDFSAILSYVQSGKALLGAGSIIVTEEREESVDFVPYYPSAFVLVVRTASYVQKMTASGSGLSGSGREKVSLLWDSVRSSFEKTFIRENRWKLFLEGIGNTLMITFFSIVFGTVLGFLLFMMCRNGNPVANTVTRVCMWLVQGMPMVVLLMLLFYVVFGKVAIDGLIVAVIGFTLTFGASVIGLLKIGVGAIDTGQYEAAYALGYSNRRTFYRIILPQAIPHVMEAFKGEIIGLIKATAIVGYIAVQDLTKMGDIVRSRTYEAFFPLIAVTVIYFALEGILGLIISKIDIHIDPKRRNRDDILKGVKTDD